MSAGSLIAMEKAGAASSGWRPTAGRPLSGVKVLDLTRVLAGPVASPRAPTSITPMKAP